MHVPLEEMWIYHEIALASIMIILTSSAAVTAATGLVEGDPDTTFVEDTGLVVAIVMLAMVTGLLVRGASVAGLLVVAIVMLVMGASVTGLLVAGASVTMLAMGASVTGLLVAGASVTGLLVTGASVTMLAMGGSVTGLLVAGASVTGLLVAGASVMGLLVMGASVAHISTSVHVPSSATQQFSPTHISSKGQSSPHPMTTEQKLRGTYPPLYLSSGQVYLMHGLIGASVVGVISGSGATVGAAGASVGGG